MTAPATLRSRLLVILLVVLIVVAGCATSESVTNVAEIGRSYLPLERMTPSPDSLVHLTPADRGDSVAIRSTHPIGDILRFWSVARSCRSPRECRGGRDAPEWPESFATLWSRELALAEAVSVEETSSAQAAAPLQGTISRDALSQIGRAHV